MAWEKLETHIKQKLQMKIEQIKKALLAKDKALLNGKCELQGLTTFEHPQNYQPLTQLFLGE